MSNGAKGATVLAVALALWASAGVAANSVDEPRKPDGSTPLQWAVFEANIPEAERLVKAGADVSATNNYGINPMLLAADIANTRLIDLLLKAGASVGRVLPQFHGAPGAIAMLEFEDNVTDIKPAVDTFGIEPIPLDDQLRRATSGG